MYVETFFEPFSTNASLTLNGQHENLSLLLGQAKKHIDAICLLSSQSHISNLEDPLRLLSMIIFDQVSFKGEIDGDLCSHFFSS